jgi:predicted nucleic acid-binding protein
VATGPRVIVVDTTVWADWFNGTASAAVDHLDTSLSRNEAGLAPVILTEVLQGFRADRDFDRARAVLVALPILTLDTDGHIDAARLYRRLRAKGLTVRGAVDCIIAQTCIAAGVELLSTDQDFAAIARHTPLRLCDV